MRITGRQLNEKQANMRDRWRTRMIRPSELLAKAAEIERQAEPIVDDLPEVAELLIRAVMRLRELAHLSTVSKSHSREETTA
jgi:hypothetical protein